MGSKINSLWVRYEIITKELIAYDEFFYTKNLFQYQ